MEYRDILDELERKQNELATAIATIRSLIGQEGSSKIHSVREGGRRTMSEAGRKKIGDATRKRWAAKRLEEKKQDAPSRKGPFSELTLKKTKRKYVSKKAKEAAA